MAPLPHVEGLAGRPPGKQARIRLVNEDLREFARLDAILQNPGCKVRASLPFAEGVRRFGCEPFDLIMVDQGSGGFEGQKIGHGSRRGTVGISAGEVSQQGLLSGSYAVGCVRLS